MDDANIHSSHHFIKQIDYRMKKLSDTIEQLDPSPPQGQDFDL